MQFKATDRIYYSALALSQCTPRQWAKARQSFRDNMLEAAARCLEGARQFDNIGDADPAVEPPHATDGSPCWCEPEIIKVEGKRRG